MTRTERAAYPRAIIKDRAESKSGMDKRMAKNGAGPHNWGSLIDERNLEDAAELDEEEELQEIRGSQPSVSPVPADRRTNSVSEEDRESARNFRKNILKTEGIDLAAIARTSAAVSTSPTRTTPITADADTASIKSAS